MPEQPPAAVLVATPRVLPARWRGRILSIAITLFWLIMMSELARTEVLPAFRAAGVTSHSALYSQLEALAREDKTSQMGIYFKDRRVGFTRSRVYMDHDELRLKSVTQIDLKLSTGSDTPVGPIPAFNASLTADARVLEGRLADFRLVLCAPPGTPPMATIDGLPVGDKLNLTIRYEGQKRTETVPFDSRQMLASDMSPAFIKPHLRVGDRWEIRTLDPSSFAVRSAWARVVSKDRVEIGERNYDALLVEIPYASYTVKLWVNDQGEVLKQRFFGITFLREEPSANTTPGTAP